MQERASFDSTTVEQQKRKIQHEKETVIESIQQVGCLYIHPSLCLSLVLPLALSDVLRP